MTIPKGLSSKIRNKVEQCKPKPPNNDNAAITVYEHCNFQGYYAMFPIGHHVLTGLNARRVRNDDLSSMIINGKYKVTLYEHDGFTGRRWEFTGPLTIPCFTAYDGLNDNISSIIVEPIQQQQQQQQQRNQPQALSKPPVSNDPQPHLTGAALRRWQQSTELKKQTTEYQESVQRFSKMRDRVIALRKPSQHSPPQMTRSQGQKARRR
jgi:hypothetical protein